MKNKEIYFLIEHQSSVDYSMSFRLEEYKLEIMKSAIDKRKIKTKEYEIPIVIPIVVYTGKEKWTARRKLNTVQDERLENLDLRQYNLIDIRGYTKEELLKSSNFIDKVFLMEKCENVDVLTKILRKIEKQLTKEEKNKLINIMRANLKGKIGQEKLEELIKEIKGEGEDMLGCVEMVWEEALTKGWEEGIKEGKNKGKIEGIREGKREGMKEGITQGRRSIISNMLKNGMSLKEIQKITKATTKEIEEARDEKITNKCVKV